MHAEYENFLLHTIVINILSITLLNVGDRVRINGEDAGDRLPLENCLSPAEKILICPYQGQHLSPGSLYYIQNLITK